MHYTFIVNPKSRSGRGEMVWRMVEPELKKQRIDYEVYYTKYEAHATEIAEGITADGKEHLLVVVGGDCTINEVVDGIRNYAKVILGYIPTGSGNDFTRVLHLPTEPYAALHQILHGKTKVQMDVGCLHFAGKKRRFAISTGIGFDADVCHVAAVSKLKRRLNKVGLGKLTYLFIALYRLLAERPAGVEITLEGKETHHFIDTYFVAVMNHPYEGGGFFFCPEAKINDGKLDVIVASGLPKWKILLLLPTAFKGKHIKYKGISIYQCKEISIKTDRVRPVHTDGEPVAVEQEIWVNVEAEQLSVLCDG